MRSSLLSPDAHRAAHGDAESCPVAKVQGGEKNAGTIDADDGCQRRRGWKSKMRGESYTSSGNTGGERALTEGAAAATAAGNSGGSSEAAARVGRSGHGSALVANKIPPPRSAQAPPAGGAARAAKEGPASRGLRPLGARRSGSACARCRFSKLRSCVRRCFSGACCTPPPPYLQSQALPSLARPCQCTFRLVVISLATPRHDMATPV
ncbi:hypothetical protein MTO96_022925 [Rhipicephalus appendiculatus]